jgi:hypothetical protein
VPEILKLPELSEDNGMSKVQVRSAWVTPELDVERPLRLERFLDLLDEVLFRNDLRDSSSDQV